MTKPLIIVESPTKVRTLKKYIGKKFNIMATAGHIKDLPPKEIGIDIEKNFKANYINIKGKSNIIKNLKAGAKDVSEVYLAPDPDREGEAIAYHVAEILKKKNRKFYRVLFHELTKSGIQEAILNTSELNKNRYDAQQARRILDRLVGYQISPLLWTKIQRGLSAGRVQSVALRIICEREKAIQIFKSEEYWSITATLDAKTPPRFQAKLNKKDGKKLKITDEKTALSIVEEIKLQNFVVEKVIRKTIKRNPLPPFITSKLQQESIRKLRFSAKKTMIIAQQLYEGIDLGPGEPEGLITYMRTDSVRIADEAAHEALQFIEQTFGKDYIINNPRKFKNKNKAQDAHEAIRPTSVYNTPEKIAPFLSKEQLALYTLIWKRFIASQMAQALINQVNISIQAGIYTLNVSGSSIKFPGFMALYISTDTAEENNKDSQNLPDLEKDEILKLILIDPKQHFTAPPPRFSEASLVKELEENGIGRPSTYATILSTIKDKGYVEVINRYFKPSELGFIVNDILVANFPEIIDVKFTANMENNLDKVETSELNYIDILHNFYNPFKQQLEFAESNMVSVKGSGLSSGIKCPKCGNELRIKVGKNGPFIACSAYPECSYSRNYERDETGEIHPIEISNEAASGKTCDKCGKPMLVKQGKFGEFLACSGYPECKNTQSINNNQNSSNKSTGVKCPEQGCNGEIVERVSKRGKLFYGCSKFPECKFAIWDKPVNKKCPQCNADFLLEKSTKKEGDFLQCGKCGFKEIL